MTTPQLPPLPEQSMTHHITTTLAELRKHDPCISGYNKLACHVTGNEFDERRQTYVRVRHTEPISIAVILESNGIDDALWALRACEQTPELVQAERLFAVWCVRQIPHLMRDPRSIAALDVAERHANNEATDAELSAARAAAWDVARAAARDAAWAAAWAAARAAARDAAWNAARAVARAVARDAAWAAAWAAARGAARAKQSDTFREVFCGPELKIDALIAKEAA